MSHDATKVLMGTGTKNSSVIEYHSGSPTTYPAGLAVRENTSGALSVTKADGLWLGVSLGRNLSDLSDRVAVARSGLGIPVLLELTPARAIVTISAYASLVDTVNDTLKIGATTFTFKTSAVGENDVLCAASGSTNTVVGAALAAAINAHSVAGPLFKAVAASGVVTITAKNNATVGTTIDLVYTDSSPTSIGLDTGDGDPITFTGGGADAADYVAIGSKVYFSDTTGKADDPNSGSTISDAIYISEVMTGMLEDGTTAAVALIDMTGGL